MQINFGHSASLEISAEFLRLLAHVFDKLRPQDPVREAWKILDVRGEGKLAPGLMAIENQWLEVRTRSIDGGGETSAATADNYDVVHSRFLQPLDSALSPPDTADVL